MFMLNTSELQQHELRMLSGMARHVSLRTECEKYSEELSAFLKDKDTLLIDVVKALKRITNEWRSWNHKLFGGLSPKAYVASVDQIFELLEWTEKTYPNIHQNEYGSKSHWRFCVDTLKRYISAHAHMQRFYSKYIQCIYSPLIFYYTSKNTHKTIVSMRNTLNNWSLLQQTGTIISERCFTPESIQFFMEIMYYPGCRDFYLVIRLIPDLCMKAAECLHMAKNLLDSNESDGFSRERAYIFEVWRPIQNTNMKTPWERKLCELTTEKSEVDEKLRKLSLQQKTIIERLNETKRKLQCIHTRIEDKAENKKEAVDQINCLVQDLANYKFQAKELKTGIKVKKGKTEGCRRFESSTSDYKRDRIIGILSRDSSEESTLAYSVLRTLSASSSVDEVRIELKATEIEVGKIQEMLTSKRNALFKIENSLMKELEVEKQLVKVGESLEQQKLEVDDKLAGIRMEERVLEGFVARVQKNMKNEYMKLPPIALTPEGNSD